MMIQKDSSSGIVTSADTTPSKQGHRDGRNCSDYQLNRLRGYRHRHLQLDERLRSLIYFYSLADIMAYRDKGVKAVLSFDVMDYR